MNPAAVYTESTPHEMDWQRAFRGTANVPVTQLGPPMHGTGNVQLFPQAPDKIRQSDEQGVGRSPGQRWPHMPHVFQMSFASLQNMAWPVSDAPRPERHGWSAPVYYDQATASHVQWPFAIPIEDPRNMAYGQLAIVPQT